MKIEKGSQLQWIKGEKLGKVETIEKIGSNWIDFNEGGRINKELLDEFMSSVEDGQTLLDENDLNSLSKLQQKDRNVKKEVIEIENDNDTIENDKENKEDDLIINLLNKIEKPVSTRLPSLDININIPNTNIYKVFIDSFGEDEVNKSLEKFIKNQISKDELYDKFICSITKMINNLDKPENLDN